MASLVAPLCSPFGDRLSRCFLKPTRGGESSDSDWSEKVPSSASSPLLPLSSMGAGLGTAPLKSGKGEDELTKGATFPLGSGGQWQGSGPSGWLNGTILLCNAAPWNTGGLGWCLTLARAHKQGLGWPFRCIFGVISTLGPCDCLVLVLLFHSNGSLLRKLSSP